MFLNKFLINHMSLIRACNSKSLRAATRRTLTIERLKSRSVLKVSGDETAVFMQGLVTNDMQHLEGGACSMYTMFLNTKGRVMYDAIIYKTSEKDAFLIECDVAAVVPLQKHLTMFRIRRKIAIDSLADDVNVWVIFDPAAADINASVDDSKIHSGNVVPCNTLDELQTNNTLIELSTSFGNKYNLTVCRDPRLSALGIRIIAPKTTDTMKIAAEEVGAIPSTDGKTSYKTVRYRLGVGEGVDDLPPGKCFPLEANGDYLHGVSFHKGCYIGQELTARTHHTGVVRKRLMPIEFDAQPTVAFVPDAPIQHGNGCSSAIGKLRGAEKNIGLALMRIAEALEAPTLKVLDVTAQAMKPQWWPQEAPKDRVAAGKDSSNQ